MRFDDETPTKKDKVTGSWNMLVAQATALAVRLDNAAFAKLHGPTTLRDHEGGGRLMERRRMVLWIADQFKLWPSDPEKWTVESLSLKPYFFQLLGETERELASMPRKGDGGAW